MGERASFFAVSLAANGKMGGRTDGRAEDVIKAQPPLPAPPTKSEEVMEEASRGAEHGERERRPAGNERHLVQGTRQWYRSTPARLHDKDGGG